MRRRFVAPAIAAGLLTATCGAAFAQFPPYASSYGYDISYQQAYGESGYNVAHPAYSPQGYILDVVHAYPAAAPEPYLMYSDAPTVPVAPGLYPPPPAPYVLAPYGHGAYR